MAALTLRTDWSETPGGVERSRARLGLITAQLRLLANARNVMVSLHNSRGRPI